LLLLVTQWSIGFSLLTVLLLWLVYWFVYDAFEKTWLSRGACTLMLFAVGMLQCVHGMVLAQGGTVFDKSFYLLLLFISAPAFFLFSREMLKLNTRIHPLLLLHLLPALVGPWLQGEIAVSLAFAQGCGYALWLVSAAWRLRNQRQYFHLELGSFIGFAFIALLILLVGLASPWLGERWYILAYANLTALVLFANLFLVIRFPDLGQKASEAVAASYAASTLKNADCTALVEKLKHLLAEEKIYRDENLSLASLAELLDLSAHQVSELINTQFGMGFSRLVREYRVEEAKRQLRDEPKASVLSIGLAVGFSSQSNFYTAFRELTGETPGQFRKSIGIK
jgi:AraC-like DNA-binding protein